MSTSIIRKVEINTPGSITPVEASIGALAENVLMSDSTGAQTVKTAIESKAANTDFVGATSNTAGTHGLVPAPAIADRNKYLKGDGNWSALGTAATKDVPSSGNASSTQVVMGNDTRLSDSRPASDVSSWAKASSKPSYTASEVGAAASSHNQAASTITAGTLGGKVRANATAAATLSDLQVRDIKISDTDITAGSTSLTTGSIYIYFT